MLSASISNQKDLLSVVSFLVVCCTLHKFIIKKKKIVFKRNQMVNNCCCHQNQHCFNCHSHQSHQSRTSYNPWQVTMGFMLVTMRGKSMGNIFVIHQSYDEIGWIRVLLIYGKKMSPLYFICSKKLITNILFVYTQLISYQQNYCIHGVRGFLIKELFSKIFHKILQSEYLATI